MYRLIISSARDGIATTLLSAVLRRRVGAVNKAVLLTSGKVKMHMWRKYLSIFELLGREITSVN